MTTVADRHGEAMRACFERLVGFASTPGDEGPLQAWLSDHLADLGFEVIEWSADADVLAGHPSFPDDPAAIDVDDRPSIGGVLELGDPEAGPTLVLNGHCDVVPVESSSWSTPPFEPTWTGDTVTARGAADMKAGLTACIYAALTAAEADDLDGRIVVESVTGEEEGGIGAAAAAMDNPYPFDRDGAIIAEPTELRPVTAVEGSLMQRIRLEGRSAHAAMRTEGESVIPRFIELHEALLSLEAERAETVSHPLYDEYENPWPINVGTVCAGNWASSVPAELVAEVRTGIAPGESVSDVEAIVDERIAAVVRDDPWLREHPPSIERFSIQFEPAEVASDTDVVQALSTTLRQRGLDATPVGATYGADSRHYQAVGIPTVLFGPGSIDVAHFPDELVDWTAVERGAELLVDTTRRFLAD